MVIEGIRLEVGFLVDNLTAVMIATVTFVSLMVHIYTIGYMHDDDGYQRFFSYIALFTFAMLMLVMANNFLQLFFGWEGVGLVSYLLDRFLVQARERDFRQPEGVSGQPGRRFRFPAGHRRRPDGVQQPRLRRCVRGRPADGQGDRAHHSRRRMVADDGDLHPAVHRRDGQIGAGAAARLAARFDGRPDPDLRA
jgi:hypothetical protein